MQRAAVDPAHSECTQPAFKIGHGGAAKRTGQDALRCHLPLFYEMANAVHHGGSFTGTSDGKHEHGSLVVLHNPLLVWCKVIGSKHGVDGGQKQLKIRYK
jgi:hypothetical protein